MNVVAKSISFLWVTFVQPRLLYFAHADGAKINWLLTLGSVVLFLDCGFVSATPYGPIELREQFPLALNHLSIAPTSARPIEEDSLRFSTDFAWSNTFAKKDGSYVFDAETRVQQFRASYGLARDIEIGLSLPLIWRGGGVLDNSIDGWHKFWGLPRADRNNEPKNQFRMEGHQEGGEDFSVSQDGFGVGDLVVNTKFSLLGSEYFAGMVSGALPTASENFLGQGQYDLGGTLLAQDTTDFGNFYSGLSYTYFSDTHISQIVLNRHIGSGFLAYEYPWSDDLLLELALVYRTSLLSQVAHYPNYALYLDLGARIRVEHNIWVNLLLRENPGGKKGTPDVTFLIGLVVDIV